MSASPLDSHPNPQPPPPTSLFHTHWASRSSFGIFRAFRTEFLRFTSLNLRISFSSSHISISLSLSLPLRSRASSLCSLSPSSHLSWASSSAFMFTAPPPSRHPLTLDPTFRSSGIPRRFAPHHFFPPIFCFSLLLVFTFLQCLKWGSMYIHCIVQKKPPLFATNPHPLSDM
ncbi:hypothetical protein BOTBODRAFT_183311 [Botryobasidium botryosum FD-172 SS1]|uniref:Uncharacterized protein n=1 Tax=Botryobasidium botryosum (strain FD-172 SS1) TaxID=930990 RepID=A0A067MY54_BOTB1|nr:hypothetical protein BOTBODRAFT_183311 [Botryobasidium botryosum FD-172 SS1]